MNHVDGITVLALRSQAFPIRWQYRPMRQSPLPTCIVYFNATWLPVVLGALQQLCRPQTWITASQAALDSVLGEAQDLLAQIAAANGPQPPIFQVTSDRRTFRFPPMAG